jgi:hypothetical protein
MEQFSPLKKPPNYFKANIYLLFFFMAAPVIFQRLPKNAMAGGKSLVLFNIPRLITDARSICPFILSAFIS